MRWLESITESMDMNLSKLHEIVEDSRARHAAAHAAVTILKWLLPMNSGQELIVKRRIQAVQRESLGLRRVTRNSVSA